MYGYENITTDWELNTFARHKMLNILVKETSTMEILETLFCLLIDLWGFCRLIIICKNMSII